MFEDEGVFERLAGALALPGRGSVRGVAEQSDATLGEGRCDCVVEDGPFCELGAFEELWLSWMLAKDWAAGKVAWGVGDGTVAEDLPRRDRGPVVPIPRTYGQVPPIGRARSIFHAPT